MEITKVSYEQFENEFKEIKPDLLVNNVYEIDRALFKVIKINKKDR
jgi:spore coat polysaccharide biosynthesis predicted glycosyltransferase SpsG